MTKLIQFRSIITSIVLYFLISNVTYGQARVMDRIEIKELRIGDTIPNVLISRISGYKKESLYFNELKDKLVIIDFWFGTCPGCIASFPKIEAMQQTFGDRIQILMVNFESQEKIKATFAKWKNVSKMYRPPRLPSIVSDTLFHKLFPHQYYPHYVWIDGNGVIKAMTGTDGVTELNIQKMLNKEAVKLDIKIDLVGFDDSKQSLLSQVQPNSFNSLQYYSSVFKFTPGQSGGLSRMIIDSAAKTVRISRRNMSVLNLFYNALEGGMGSDPYQSARFDFGKRIVLDVNDSSKYLYKKNNTLTKGEWQIKNCYSYETVMPLFEKSNIFIKMLEDLEEFFGVTCKVEKRRMKCIALVRTSDKDKIKFDGKVHSIFDQNFRPDSTLYRVHGSRTQWVLNAISKANIKTPYVFLDQTNYEGAIDMEFKKKSLGDIPALRKELRLRFDLDLVECEQDLDVLIFSEKAPEVTQ